MCGIAGYAGVDEPEHARGILRKMVGAIAGRGPDGEGFEEWPQAWLGHRRLAIIDLSDAGRQPMLSDDRQTGVVFNGCIYNFVEIRTELERHGHRFRSQCDTEVLVRGYEQWGIDDLVKRLRGMFAFAIWDERRKTLNLVRDRLGVKPLIYAVKNGRIGFASTVTALRAAGLAGEIDSQAVLEFLEFGYVTDERTIFSEASKLGAGELLEWKDGRVSKRTYWTLPEADESSKIGFEEAVEETERLLVESVKLRLVADVPIGVLLSGGIDSTLVCWALQKLNANITAFTVGTPGDPGDETEATRETAAILGIPHQVVTLPRQEDGMLGQLTAAYGEPFACSSALGMLQVSAAVKPHATVLLTGDGGDDVFLGYEFQRQYFHIEQFARKLPRAAVPLWKAVRPVFQAAPPLRRAKHLFDYATGGLGQVNRAHDGLPFFESRGMMGGQLRGRELQQRNIAASLDSARNLLTDLLRYQQRMWFVSEFMTKVDGGTMYHALEARSPLLDQKMWEFAARLPFGTRLNQNVLKAILREIARRRVGPAVASRKKQGFTIPVERWLAGPWRNVLTEAARRPLVEQGGWIREGAFKTAVEASRERDEIPRQLWFLTVLENWLRYNARETSSQTLEPLAART
jgi:asparagine synthase (glutamine-hydrolysing)